jgi:aminopeptidase-like protein/aminoglycoside N3'-acetyltransferase
MSSRRLNKYSGEDIVNALQNLGLMRGDMVYFSTGFGFLGKAEGVKSSEDLNKLFFDSIKAVLGPDGTILVPTFSYTFGKSLASEPAVFDPNETKSETGPFPEFFRQQSGVSRSLDPMVSVSGIGPQFKELIAGLPPTSYGADSVFDRLTKTNAKICNIGIGTNWVPFIHHADWLAKVSYRHEKLFFGEILDKADLYKKAWVYAVPISRSLSMSHGHRLGELAEDAGIWKWDSLGRGRIYVASYKSLFDFTADKLEKDQWLTTNTPKSEFKLHEKETITIKKGQIELRKEFAFIDFLSSLYPLKRHLVSDGIDQALDLIARWMPITVHQYPTGLNCLDWIVPEKWHCNEAYLKTMDGKVVFSYKTNPFHVMSYSLPFEGEVSRDLLVQHLHTNESTQQAIPIKQALLNRDWGFCCSHQSKNSLSEEKYRVFIDSGFSSGAMKVGEVIVQGQTNDTIILCTYLDGPGQANETLSGVLVGMNVILGMLKNMSTRFTYRLLILPGPAGLAGWLSSNAKIVPSIKGLLNLRALGCAQPHNLEVYNGYETVFENVCKAVMGNRDPESQLTPADKFFEVLPLGKNPLCKSSENVYKFPMLTLYRSLAEENPHYPYFGYQTCLDDIEHVDCNAMSASSDLLTNIIADIERSELG